MKILSWNVNGIRSVMKKTFGDFMSEHKPDILCLQETRGYTDEIETLLPDYDKHWVHAEKKGYAGTAIFYRTKGRGAKALAPVAVNAHIGKKEHDQEGRVLTAEYDDFFLVTVYTPNSGDGLKRLEYRQRWDAAFLAFMKKLEKRKPVIVCGDLNVAHEDIDLARPDTNRNKTAGFTDEERDGLRNILKAGYFDTFRDAHPNLEGAYSYWSYRMGARKRNVGWRIDYFLASEKLRPRVKKAFILSNVEGSDHCPVGIELK